MRDGGAGSMVTMGSAFSTVETSATDGFTMPFSSSSLLDSAGVSAEVEQP